MDQRLYWRLSFFLFLQYAILGAWFVTTGTYLLNTLGFSGQQVGWVYGTTAIAATISPFWAGLWVDRYLAIERMLGMLHLLGAVVMVSASLVTDFSAFYPLILLYTILYLPTFSLSSALCLRQLPRPDVQFPLVRVWGSAGWILITLLIGWAQIETQVTPLRVAAGLSLLQGIYCFTLPHTPPEERKATEGAGGWRNWLGSEVWELLRRRDFGVLMVTLALLCIPIAYYYSFLNPFMHEQGWSNPAGKMSLGQISEVVFMLLLPFFIRHWALKWVMFIGLFAWGARYFLFAQGYTTGQETWVLVGILMHGIAFNFTGLTGQLYVDQQAPRHLRSTAQGFLTFITQGAGALIGALIAGWSVEKNSLPDGMHAWGAIWVWPAAIGVGVAVIFAIFFRSQRTAPAP